MMTVGLHPRSETVFLWLGPAAAVCMAWLGLHAWALSVPAAATAAVTAWCAVWWLTEPVPIPVTSLLMPVLAATAVASGIRPELLMVPAAISASCAFMLPVATAPNAVIYGSGRVSIRRMAREGLVINLLGALVITLVVTLRF